MLATALVPTLSRAMSHAQSATTQWTEVCTARGMQLVAVADPEAAGADARPSSSLLHLEHCPLCVLGQGAACLPPPEFDLPAPQAAERPVAAAFVLAPRTHRAWHSAQPRGPPPLS